MRRRSCTLNLSDPADSRDSVIEILALDGVAYARLHQFPEPRKG